MFKAALVESSEAHTIRQFAKLLQLKVTDDIEQVKDRVRVALGANGFGVACPRCSGTGSMPFVRHNGVCYQCNGRTFLFPELTPTLWLRVKREFVDAGLLDEYHARAKRHRWLKDQDLKGMVRAMVEKYGPTMTSVEYREAQATMEGFLSEIRQYEKPTYPLVQEEIEGLIMRMAQFHESLMKQAPANSK